MFALPSSAHRRNHLASIPRPDPSDYSPAFLGEIALVPDAPDFGALLVDQLVATRSLMARFRLAHAGLRYAPDKWSVREVLGHLADVERVLSYRALRILRGDETALPGFDHNAYVPAGRFEERSLVSVLEEFSAVRAATISLVGGTHEGLWTRRTMVGSAPMTAAALLYLIAGHELHHQILLRERYLPLVMAGNGSH